MATGLTPNFSIPYPLSTDPVNVAGDIQQLSEDIDNNLTEWVQDISSLMWTTGGTFGNGLQAPTYNDSTGKMSMSLTQDIQTTASPTFVGITLSGDIAVNGGDITTSQTTFNLINATTTTLNIGQAATTISMGATSGTTTVRNDLNVASGKVFKVNSTEVLSGSTLGSGVTASSLTSVGTLSSGTWSATAIAADKGGTGQTSFAIGDILYASTTSAISKLADVATGSALISGGIATAPSWGKIGLTTHVSGILAGTNGGTGVDNSTKTITLADNLTTSGAYPITLTATASTNVTLPTTGTIATTSNKLSDFASTTSAELITVISDEQGSGSLVFATSPSLTTPNIGAATGSTLSLTGTTVTMSSATVGAPTDDIYFKVERGTSTDVSLRWNETLDQWEFTNDGSTFTGIGSGGGGGAGLQDILMFAGM